MQPVLWQPSVELSESEEHIVKRIRRATLFVFLRYHRHELLDEVLQRDLAGLYRTGKRGQPPIAPAQLALATIVQAYTGVSDDEVVEATLMDRAVAVGSRLSGRRSGTVQQRHSGGVPLQSEHLLANRGKELLQLAKAFGTTEQLIPDPKLPSASQADHPIKLQVDLLAVMRCRCSQRPTSLECYWL
jgi:hypothetical protein